MSDLSQAEDIVPLGTFQAQASRFLSGLKAGSSRHLVITQDGEPTAVVLSTAEFDRLNTQARFIAAILKGLEDEREGRLLDDAELEALLKFEAPAH